MYHVEFNEPYNEEKENRASSQGLVYMEKSCTGQEGHPSSRVNFSERLHEEKVAPFEDGAYC